ncbi:hypothetical protein [Terrihabitans rhizophilus]|uniref:Uncharacterized protein n=1 Tax=Terrihabitans rhizophilus TaxID=3092662 RepID=A0ABU4RNB9_9HYPH|nr:hypothetical protein [Terrihabitans sp. PJ23]MDX6806309.1 hypothetical protein [Terrihabitans sp. PJ23]
MSEASTITYDSDGTYEVKLTRAVNYRGAMLLPLPRHEMSGRALKAIVEQEGPDVVDSAEPR